MPAGSTAAWLEVAHHAVEIIAGRRVVIGCRAVAAGQPQPPTPRRGDAAELAGGLGDQHLQTRLTAGDGRTQRPGGTADDDHVGHQVGRRAVRYRHWQSL